MVKLISILGSTGSIGLSTLNIISKKKKLFRINLLSANKNFKAKVWQQKILLLMKRRLFPLRIFWLSKMEN